jgi:hypothetical protein
MVHKLHKLRLCIMVVDSKICTRVGGICIIGHSCCCQQSGWLGIFTFFSHSAQTDSVHNPHSHPVGSGTLSLASIPRNVMMTTQCSAKIKNAWSYSSALPYVFILTRRYRSVMAFMTGRSNTSTCYGTQAA